MEIRFNSNYFGCYYRKWGKCKYEKRETIYVIFDAYGNAFCYNVTNQC